MKTNFKRLFALALSLCLLASLMVPAAFAEGETTEATPSANVAETYNVRLVDMTQVDASNRTGWNTSFGGSSGYKSTGVKAYDKDAQVWNYNTTLTNKIDAAYADGSLDWKYLDSEGEATYREDRMFQLRSDGWVALQIRVSASGMYALNIATDKTVDEESVDTEWSNISVNTAGEIISKGYELAGNVSAWIVPVADFSVENIDAILVDENSVGTSYLAADATSVTFAKQRMEAGEYVVIYDGPNNYSVSEMSLLGDAYEMENVATYDMNPFDLTNTDITTWTGTVNEVLIPIVDGTSSNDYVTPGNSIDYAVDGWASFHYSGTWRAQAAAKFDPCLKSPGNWAAIKLNVPASGEQYLSLTTDRMDVSAPFSNSYGKGITATVSAYLFPAAGVAKADVAGKIEAGEGYIGTRSLFTTEDTTMTFDKAYVEAGEYILVVYLEAVNGGRYPISTISLDKVAGQDLPESEIVTGTVTTYDFEIYNNERYAPIFTKEDGTTGGRSFANGAFSGLEGVYNAGTRVETIIARDYAAGIINFKLKEFNCSSHTFEGDLTDTDYGLRIQKAASTEPASQHLALVLNVPATALYTVKLNVAYNSVDTLKIYAYDADAEGTVAENMTEANLVSVNNTIFNTVLTAGDNIIVFQIADTTSKDTLRLTSIDLIINNESVTYDFGLANNEGFMKAWAEANGGVETAFSDGGNAYKWTGSSALMNPYSAIATLYREGKINWALNTSSGSNAVGDVGTESKNFRLYTNRIRCMMENADAALNYTAFTLKVSTPGTYNVAVNYTKTSDSVKVYLFKAPAPYAAYADRLDAATLLGYMTEENLVHGTADYYNPEVNFTYSFEEAGDYIIAFAPTRTDKNTAMYLSSIVMEPVVYSYVADGVGYNTLEEAVEKATDYVFMTENTQVADLIIPAGVTLDLNGYTLYATSVDATAPGAQIIDAMDGKSLIRGDITFNENNAQLPLYDIDADGYKLYNVNVESCATTGTGSRTKFWFKVSFTNEDAYALIGNNTELRIVAEMAGVYKETTENHTAGDSYAAKATSTVSFVNKWAANNDSYIVISAVGSGISSFTLNPGVSANGVTIVGAAMGKGSAA